MRLLEIEVIEMERKIKEIVTFVLNFMLPGLGSIDQIGYQTVETV
jgi:hypothetical protein